MDTKPFPTIKHGNQGHPHHHHSPVPSGKIPFSFIIQILFILAAVGLIVFFRQHPAFSTLSITFVAIFLEALPFMLLGSLIGGFIEVFVSKEALTKFLPGTSWRTILIAAGAGFFFPVCECAIVPVVRRLFQKGLPLGAGIAFLLGGPIVNPLVGLSTAVAYGYQWTIAIDRIVLGYLIAVTVGILVDLFFSKQNALAPGLQDNNHTCACGHDHHPEHGEHRLSLFQKIIAAFQHAAGDFLDIGRYLIFGAFIAALLQTVIARGEMAAIASTPVLAILTMMLLAVILNLCSEADAFIAATFRTSLPLSAQMAFMVLGPMLDIKLILMYFQLFRKRFIIALSGTTFMLVFLSMLIKYWSQG